MGLGPTHNDRKSHRSSSIHYSFTVTSVWLILPLLWQQTFFVLQKPLHPPLIIKLVATTLI